jgi:YD repeat-containing protein
VNEPILVHPAVNERPKRRYIGHGSLQHHSRPEVGDLFDPFRERRRCEGRTGVPARFLQFGNDVLHRGQAERAVHEVLRVERRVLSAGGAASGGCPDFAGHRVGFWVHAGGVQRLRSPGDPQEATTSVDGKLLASIDRDLLRRRVVVTDHTRGDGLVVEHELGFDRCGRLASRTRGGQGLSWEYVGDGNRTRFTDAHGTSTIYTRDAAGRLTAVSNPSLGEAAFTHDAAGRLTSATSGDLVQERAYRYGSLSEHSRTDRTDLLSADVTLIGRDGDGRITALTRAGAATRYGYDGAGQMVSAATTGSRRGLGR